MNPPNSTEPSQPCARCGADTAADRDAGLTYCVACGTGLSQPSEVACPGCSFPLRRTVSGRIRCPNCGHIFQDSDPEYQCNQALRERKAWRTCFWILFVTTPLFPFFSGLGAYWLSTFPSASVLQIMFVSVPRFILIFGPVAGGLLGCGFCLTRLRSRPGTVGELIVSTITAACGVFLIYLTIIIVGSVVFLVLRRK